MQSVMLGYNNMGDSIWQNHYSMAPVDEKFLAVCESKHLSTFTAFLRNYPFPSKKEEGSVFVAYPNGWYYLAKSFGGLEDDFFNAMAPTADGGYISVGQTLSFDSQQSDIIVVKID